MALRVIVAALFCLTAADSAGAQGPPPGAVTSLPIMCYPADTVEKSSDLGRPLWRGVIRSGSTVYEMLETPNGWLLMLKTREQICIVASGDQHAVPAGRADQAPAQ